MLPVRRWLVSPWPLWLTGLLSALVYLAYVLLFVHGKHSSSPVYRELFFFPSLAALAGLYIKGYQRVKTQTTPPKLWIIAGGVLLLGLALFISNFNSSDVLGYINRGWQQAAYGTNPYSTVVSKIPMWKEDDMFTHHWTKNPCPYGFLFARLAWYITALSHGSLNLAIVLFKSVNVLVFGLCALLITAIAKAQQPVQSPWANLYCLLWSPLLLLQNVANAHNDMWLAVFTLLTAYALLTKRWTWVLPSLMAATLIKYLAAVLFPLTLIYLVKNAGIKATLRSTLFALGTLLFLGWPYWSTLNWRALGLIGSNATLSANSLHAMVIDLLVEISKILPFVESALDEIELVFKIVIWLCFVIFMTRQLRPVLHTPEFTWTHWLYQAILLQFVLVVLVSSKFYPWYLGMFFPLLLLLPATSHLKRLGLLLSLTQLFWFTVLGQAHMANTLVMLLLPLAGYVWRYRPALTLPTPLRWVKNTLSSKPLT